MEIKKLPNIFNNSFFRVPDYQRGYSWEKPHLEDLWQDILNIHNSKDSNKVHYTGLITLEEVSNLNTKNENQLFEDCKGYYIVDGQQRLTTLIILLSSLYEKVKELEKQKLEKPFKQRGGQESIEKKYLYITSSGKNPVTSYFFGYDIDDPSNEYLKTKIFGHNSSKSSNEKETIYTQNMEVSKLFFSDKINSMLSGGKNKKIEILDELFTTITNKLVFGYLELNAKYIDIHVTFETMNNRGKFLSKLELLKNRLIYLSTIIESNDKESNKEQKKLREDINHAWKTIYTYLGAGSTKLNDDEFLKNHYIMFFEGETDIKKFDAFLLDEYFTSKNFIKNENIALLDFNSNIKKITTYVESIQKCIINWFFMNFPEKIDKEYDSEGLVKKQLILLKKLDNSNFKPLILGSLTKYTKDKELHSLLSEMERCIFEKYKISRAKSDNGKNFLYSLAQETYSNPQNAIFTKDKIFKSKNFGTYTIQKLIDFLNSSMENKQKKGWYAWDGIQYFLFEYEEHLRITHNNTHYKLDWETTTRDSIEHVFPQKPADNTWLDIQKEKEKTKTQEKICASLGNLALINKDRNSILSNKSFKEKKREYQMGCYAENEIAKETEWTPQKIKERGGKMLDFLFERWNLKKPNQEIINKLLLF